MTATGARGWPIEMKTRWVNNVKSDALANDGYQIKVGGLDE